MTFFALIRHGTTEWNAAGLVQGSSDIPLNTQGFLEVSSWALPSIFEKYRWLSSSLQRALQTAFILAGYETEVDKRLVEMDWGSWEGRALADLKEEIGDLRAAWEAKGLDFRGPNGESPRDVQNRMVSMLQEVATKGEPTIAVTHKGFIRAIYARAINWDMTSKPSDELLDGCVQLFKLDATGEPSVVELNIKLV
jgi:broad specificity phosphatase PhoE